MSNENAVIEDRKVQKFSKFLRERKSELGISMRDFAKQSDLSVGFISNILNARRGIPKPDTIRKLAKGLQVSESTLFNEAGMEYFSKGHPYIEKKQVDRHPVFSYKGKTIDKASMAVIQRILDNIPDPENKK